MLVGVLGPGDPVVEVDGERAADQELDEGPLEGHAVVTLEQGDVARRLGRTVAFGDRGIKFTKVQLCGLDNFKGEN